MQRILRSDDNRLITRIIKDQIANPYDDCWASTTKAVLEKYSLDLNKLNSITKKEIKSAIEENINQTLQNKCKIMKKLRFINKFGQDYIYEWNLKDVQDMMEFRLDC